MFISDTTPNAIYLSQRLNRTRICHGLTVCWFHVKIKSTFISLRYEFNPLYILSLLVKINDYNGL